MKGYIGNVEPCHHKIVAEIDKYLQMRAKPWHNLKENCSRTNPESSHT